MDAKHTPGPWTVEPLQATQGADMAICGGGHVIAVIQHDPELQDNENDVDGDNVVWHEEDLPNAALITAAPDLLGALERIVPYFASHDGDLHHSQDGSREKCSICVARAAISKAKGGAQ